MYGTIEQIARVIHAANAEYARTIGDNSLTSWEESPQWLRETVWNGVKAQLDSFQLWEKFDPAISHELWRREKLSQGWKYGAAKDYEAKEHPCLVAYDDLPVEHQMKDKIFGAIMQAFWDTEALKRGEGGEG